MGTQWQGQTFIKKENHFFITREVNLATEQETCYKCLEKEHLARFCNNNAKCENCGKVGHQSRDCRSNKGKCENSGVVLQQSRDCRMRKDRHGASLGPRNQGNGQ